MNQFNHMQQSTQSEIIKAHDVLQQYITELFKCVATTPNMPNGTAIKKAANCIGRLTHAFVDFRQHNTVLLEENRELYRQLELRGAECDAYLDEISSLQEQLQHWKDYYAANADLFAPPVIAPPIIAMNVSGGV